MTEIWKKISIDKVWLQQDLANRVYREKSLLIRLFQDIVREVVRLCYEVI